MRTAFMLVDTTSTMNALHPKKYAPDLRIVVFYRDQVPPNFTSILKKCR